MPDRISLAAGAAVGVLLVGVSATAANAAPQIHRHNVRRPTAHAEGGEIGQLKLAVQALQAWQAQESATEAARRKDEAAQLQALRDQLAKASARAEAQADSEIETIPAAVDAEIKKRKAPSALTYKGVTITLGGFAAAETILRSRNEESDVGSNYSKLPFANNAVGRTSEWRATARQSRLSFLAQGNIDSDTHAAFYGEFDFMGAGQTANSNESNSYAPRIRNLYETIDWDRLGLHVLAGQSWSLLALNGKGISPRNEVIPPTIEAQYVPGFDWARQPQIRLVKDFDKVVWLGLSMENPQTTFASTPSGVSGLAPGVSVVTNGSGNTTINSGAATGPTASSEFDTANTLSLNHVPDVIAKIAYEPRIGGARPVHLELVGLYRDFEDRVTYTAANPFGFAPGARNAHSTGWGIGGGVTWAAWPGHLDLEGSALTGRGIGRYGSAQLPDTYVAPTGELTPIPQTMFLGGATFHATPKLDLYLFGGAELQDRVDNFVLAGRTFGYGSPAATLGGCLVEGASCTPDLRSIWQVTIGLWDKPYTGSFGQVRLGLQYSHTSATAFAGLSGAGGPTLAPSAAEDMVFTSFRYYPF